MNKINKKILYLTTVLIFFVIPIISTLNLYFINIIHKKVYILSHPEFILYMSMVILFYIYIYDIKTNKKVDKFDLLVFVNICIGFIVCLCAINKTTSIYGNIYRHDGYLTFVTYNLLFITWKRLGQDKDKKRIINIIIILALVNSIYALFQTYTDLPFIVRYKEKKYSFGFCTYNNFFGTLIATALSIVTSKFFMDKKFSIIQLLLILLFLLGLLNCQSTGPILAYFIFVIFIVIFLLKKRLISLKKLLITVGLIIFVVISYITYKNIYNNGICELCNIKHNTINNGGSKRIEIWKNTLQIVKDHPIIGIGYDNLIYAYPNFKNITTYTPVIEVIDNAHNVYLNTLVSSGILGFIPVMFLYILTFITGLKQKNKETIMLFSAFVTYSMQAFTNINVIQVAPIYFVIIGILLSTRKFKSIEVIK